MTYTIHSDKRGFYFKVWSRHAYNALRYETSMRYNTEEMTEIMAKDYVTRGAYV